MKNIYKEIGIYRITNLVNGMSYIGKTGYSFGDRWDCHRALLNSGKHDNANLQKEWNKYGSESFEFAALEIVLDKSLLNELEIKYIREYKERELSYNIADGGDDPYWTGKHLTDEVKRKIGEKNRVNMTGKKLSDETKKKMSESQTARKWTDEEKQRCREKSRETNTGRVRSNETKELLRKINQENPPSAKFSPQDILDIRSKRKAGEKLSDLAAEYGSSESYISNIIHGRRWGHIK